MKQSLYLVLFLIFSCLNLQAQQSSPQGDKDYLFNLASEQFHEGEFSGCFRTIGTWIEESNGSARIEEAQFMQAVSSYELNRRETSVLLINFLRNYPSSPFTEKVFYLLGCSAMNAGQFKDAIEFFRRSPELSLVAKDRIDLNFRYAFVSMQLGDLSTARKLFSALASGDSRYAASSSYFCTYMDYVEGKSKEAAEGFSRFNGHEQFSSVVPYFNAQLLYSEGKITESINIAKELLAGKPDDVQKTELLRLLGAAYFDNNDVESSRIYYKEYLALNPELLNSDKFRIGVLNYIAGEYERAEIRLSGVAEIENVIGQSSAFYLGLVKLKMKDSELALKWFEKAGNAGFDKEVKEKALYNYAISYSESAAASAENKIEVFRKFLDEFPASEKANIIRAYLADVYLSEKDYANALSAYESITKPDNKTIIGKSKVLFLLGTEAFGKDNFENAAKYFTESSKLSASVSVSNLETNYWKGESLYQLKRYSEAYKDLKLFADQPESSKLKSYASALYSLGYISFNLKNYTESQKWFDKFLKLTNIKEDVRYADALNRMGDCSFIAKNYEKAEKYYQDADKVSGQGNDYSVFQKAYALGLRKMHQAKFDLLKQFETKFPESNLADDALFEAGKACIALKKTDLAISTFSNLMEKYPDSPFSRKAGIQIGLLYYNESKTVEATAAYKRVIESYPGTEEAKMALSDLKMIYVNSNSVSEYIDYTKNLSQPVSIEISEQDSLAWLAAENLLMEGKKEEAIRGFESYLSKFPGGSFVTDCHYHMGKLALGSDNNTNAKIHLEYVSDQSGNRYQADALETLAELYYYEKDYEKALGYYNKLKGVAEGNETRILAMTGQLRSNYFLKNDNFVIENAMALLLEKDLSEDIQKEAIYYRAKSYLNKKQDVLAKADLIKLSSEVSSLNGAESRYLLADLYFRQGSLKESEKLIQDFITDGTPHSYWLARGFILLSDINFKNKDYFQAKQYLESLKENYHAEDEIAGLIETRLKEINKQKN